MHPLFHVLYNKPCYYIKLTQILPPKNWLSKVPQNGSLSHLPLAWFPIKSDHVGMAFWQKLNKGKGQLVLSMGKLKVIIKTCIYGAAPLTQPRKCWERPCAHQSRPLEPDLLACFSIITCSIRTVEGNYDSYRSERWWAPLDQEPDAYSSTPPIPAVARAWLTQPKPSFLRKKQWRLLVCQPLHSWQCSWFLSGDLMKKHDRWAVTPVPPPT